MTRTVASPLLLGSADRNELLDIRQHRSTPQSIVLRINIVLGAAEGHANHALARELSTSLPTVLLWRRRYAAEGILGLLDDHPRSGRPKTITPDQEAAIVDPCSGALFDPLAVNAILPKCLYDAHVLVCRPLEYRPSVSTLAHISRSPLFKEGTALLLRVLE